MKFSFGIVLAVLLLFSPVCAQDPSAADAPASKQDIEKLLVAMHLDERMRLVMEDSRKRSQSLAEEVVKKDFPELTVEQRAQLKELYDEMIKDIYKDDPVSAVLQDIVPIYQRHLTESDSQQLITFYSSPVGQKVLRELPEITSETMQVWSSHLQPRIEAAISRLKDRAERMVEEDGKKQNPNQPKGKS